MNFVVFFKKKVFTQIGRFFSPKLGDDQEKKGLQPTNSDGFCGVLQRTNKKNNKNSNL